MEALPWAGQIDVDDPQLGIPVELHVRGSFAGNLPADRGPWLEATLLQLLPHAVAQAGAPLLTPDTTGLAEALQSQCGAILGRRGIEGHVVVESAWVSPDSKARLEAALRAHAAPGAEGDDLWESTMMSAGAEMIDEAMERAAAKARARVGVQCSVLWSDGRRYAGRIVDRREGSLQVEMEDGQTHWIGAGYVEET